MKIKNISKHAFLINGIKLEVNKIAIVDNILGEKLLETNKGELLEIKEDIKPVKEETTKQSKKQTKAK